MTRALRTIRECQARFSTVTDYACTFYKRERINDRITPLFVMSMKARTAPRSIYFKFENPYKGREAIYVEGRNDGKVLAHDVGSRGSWPAHSSWTPRRPGRWKTTAIRSPTPALAP